MGYVLKCTAYFLSLSISMILYSKGECKDRFKGVIRLGLDLVGTKEFSKENIEYLGLIGGKGYR